MLAILGAMLVACPANRKADPGALRLADGPFEVEGAAVEPGPWRGGGLRLMVPPGWRGHEGLPGSELLLWLRHDVSGARLEVRALPAREAPRPLERPGCTPSFLDAEGAHRAVPLLSKSVAATCLVDGPGVALVQGWYGLLGDREIHLEVIYPPGRSLEGRLAVEPLLQALAAE